MHKRERIAVDLWRLLNTPKVGPARVRSILDWLQKTDPNIEISLDDHEGLENVLSGEQIEKFISNKEEIEQKYHDLAEDPNFGILSVYTEKYPERLTKKLGKYAPILLFCLGNTELLSSPSAGFCGARKASERGLQTGADCSDQLVHAAINVLSGYAPGVDMATHKAALSAGGTTTIVLAEGISHFRIKRELEPLWDWSRVLVVSQFLPGIPWSARNAMNRNRVICGLSDALIVVEAGPKGGSIEAGRSALQMRMPVFAPVYQGMPEQAYGNKELLSRGAQPLLKSKSADRANIKPVVEAIRKQARLPDLLSRIK